jgi:hypothetical protein
VHHLLNDPLKSSEGGRPSAAPASPASPVSPASPAPPVSPARPAPPAPFTPGSKDFTPGSKDFTPGSRDLHRRGPWQPLFEGSERERLLDTAAEIAAALHHKLAAVGSGPPAAEEHHSLGGGLAGIAVFFAYLDRSLPDRGHAATARRLLNLAIDRSNAGDRLPSLYGGFPGVAWALEHLGGWVVDTINGEAGEEIAAGVHEVLGQTPWRGDWDLIGGLVGLGIYARERWPRSWGKKCLERVVARLAELAERRPDGFTWRSPELHSEETYNLGLAHGVPGVIGLLAEACELGAGREQALPLLEGAVGWLLAQRLPPGGVASFPPTAGPTVAPRPSRTAWCYGDLGIAAVLMAAARRQRRRDWEAEAMALALGAARRPPEASEVVDACVCHGAAGIAHLFNRLFQATGEPLLAEAAHGWLDRAVAMRQPGKGVAGFAAWLPDETGALGWLSLSGLLYGAAGVGLALLAAAAPVEPAWDRALLVTIPARAD